MLSVWLFGFFSALALLIVLWITWAREIMWFMVMALGDKLMRERGLNLSRTYVVSYGAQFDCDGEANAYVAVSAGTRPHGFGIGRFVFSQLYSKGCTFRAPRGLPSVDCRDE